MEATSPFLRAFHGYLTNLLRWEQLDGLWQQLKAAPDATLYLYAVGEPPPTQPASAEQVHRFIDELDALLRREHDYDYCGIVYADDPQEPTLVKIYDPNNLGSVCGSGLGPPPLPGWVISRHPPIDLPAAQPAPAGRRRFWQRLFG